jgi:two-component system OmpR family sensor kinase
MRVTHVRSLYAKLGLVLLALLAVAGVLYVALTLFTTRRYVEEINQKLNHDLAAHLVADRILLRDGQVDRPALERTFHDLMVIHPQIELYLLGPAGEILAYSAPPGSVKRERVSLGPVRAFLDPSSSLPILGDDPRSPTGRKVFSAAAVPFPGEAGPDRDGPQGFIYVVLGGEQYDSVASTFEASYILRLSAFAAAGGLVLVLVSGLILFRLLTRRLRRLTVAMERFEASGVAVPEGHPAGDASSGDNRQGDELEQLSQSFQRMSRRIAEQVREIQEKERLRRELVANVSHDLRTPLASLQGYLETLSLKAGKLAPAEQQQYVEIALRHSERLGRLVSDLFELAKLDARETELRREPFSMAELVQDVVQEFQLEAQHRSVHLRAELPDGLPQVEADIALMERVLENLLENALRHTPARGAVTVALGRSNGAVRVEVADTGCGIAESEIPLIFGRFYRASRGGVEPGERGGAGLGLAITKRILELHGTSIEVSSRIGRGSSFRFELPSLANPFEGGRVTES